MTYYAHDLQHISVRLFEQLITSRGEITIMIENLMLKTAAVVKTLRLMVG